MITIGAACLAATVGLGFHIVGEAIVDRIPTLRKVCRSRTQVEVSTLISASIRAEVAEGVWKAIQDIRQEERI